MADIFPEQTQVTVDSLAAVNTPAWEERCEPWNDENPHYWIFEAHVAGD